MLSELSEITLTWSGLEAERTITVKFISLLPALEFTSVC